MSWQDLLCNCICEISWERLVRHRLALWPCDASLRNPKAYIGGNGLVARLLFLVVLRRPRQRASDLTGWHGALLTSRGCSWSVSTTAPTGTASWVTLSSTTRFISRFLLLVFSRPSNPACLFSFFAESLPQPPTASQTPQDPAQFMLMGFMLLPLLFVIFGMLQHLSGNARRQVSGSDDVAKPPPGGPGRSDGAGPSGTA